MALEPWLQPGEFLRHWAYGIKPVSIEKKLLLFMTGVLFAIVAPFSAQMVFLQRLAEKWWDSRDPAVAFLKIPTIAFLIATGALFCWITKTLTTKSWVIGLTNQRLIALLCKNRLQVKKAIGCRLDNLPLVKTETRLRKAVIEIHDPQNPILAAFYETESLSSLREAVAIASILDGIESRQPGDLRAGSYCPECKAEYHSGITHCNRCQVRLIEYRGPAR
ncbi:MAG TPA: hypothetical protein VFD58_21290 [Blastocatellia bacterium]|nr:hypothetical protein [Blastocatellia bacterium]